MPTPAQAAAGKAWAQRFILTRIRADTPSIFERAAEAALNQPAHQAELDELVHGVIDAALAAK